MDLSKPRPSFITFDTVSIEDRSKSIETGKTAWKDVDVAYVTPVGSKDRTELVVSEYFTMLEKEVMNDRFDPSWLANYKQSYENYKIGKVDDVEGTALKNWPSLGSPSLLKLLNELGFRSVEEVAAMNEEAIQALGMGARALKQKAIDWLESSKDIGKTSEELSAVKAENENLKVSLEALTKEFETLKESVKKK